MKIVTHEMIKKLHISAKDCYNWIDYAMKNRDIFINPHKTRVPLEGSNYFNVMPCVIPSDNRMGLKVVTRSEKRREEGKLNLDSKIMLYTYDTCELLAVMDANYITTMRTAAVAVHTMLNMVMDYSVVSMIGLGNIGTSIGDILFELIKDRSVTVKLYKYKDQAERFVNRYENKFSNVEFIYCDSYRELMANSDVVISSITYASEDFVPADVYKRGCTVIPVHMRGFMDCDLHFDHVITSDLESIQGFKYYDKFNKLSLLNDVIFDPNKVRKNSDERVIVYNLGLALHDILYASKIYDALGNIGDSDLKLDPSEFIYV